MGDQESPPLPRGSYNFNFDDFDENTNPFETKPKVKVLDNDTQIDPFQPSKSLSKSPTTSNNNIPDTVNSERDDIISHAAEPVKTRNKIPRSPIQSPDNSGEQQNMQIQDSSPEQTEPLPESQSPPTDSPKPQSQKKPAIRKGIKKPKFKSKLKPPPNFGTQDEDIQIFAPPPATNLSDPSEDADVSSASRDQASEETVANEQNISHDITSEETACEHTQKISHDNPSEESAANENTQNMEHDNAINTNEQDVPDSLMKKNKSRLQEVHDSGPEMAQSLEMVHDFGANEMPYEENEGISPAPEVFNDSVGLDIAGDAQINSVYLAGNGGVEQPAKSSGKDIDESKDENLTQNGNDSSMTTPPSKSTPRVPKHPATRVLEGEVKSEKTQGDEGDELQYYDAYEFPPSLNDSSRVQKNSMRERMENTDSIVHLVQDGAGHQVLKYSQSDWNKMKQELELDFQTRLLNKEREWSKKLADKEKTISRLRDENKLLQQSNDDMRLIVTEFEKTISQLHAETEKTTSESQSSMEDIVKERDQAIDDLQGVEMAFSDLHRRYEKTKGVVEGLKKNEEVLKKCIEDYQTKLKKSEEKLQTIKQQAEEKLDLANVEMDKLRKSTSSDMARLEAAMRKSDLQVASLQKSLDQKVKENEELTAICDELISKVGSD